MLSDGEKWVLSGHREPQGCEHNPVTVSLCVCIYTHVYMCLRVHNLHKIGFTNFLDFEH